MVMTRFTYPLAGTALLLAMVIAGLIGGPAFPLDLQTDMWFIGWRAEHAQLTRAAILLTQLGGSLVLVPLALIVALLLWRRQGRRDALLFLGTVMTGRAMIEIIKLSVDRPRPAFDPYPVFVSSQSFPSGHAGNSMLTFVAMAMFLAPERWRRQALAGAIALAMAIGWTRPMLGVHWPTDVVAGWCFGLLWVGLWWRLSRRGETAASGCSPASRALPQE